MGPARLLLTIALAAPAAGLAACGGGDGDGAVTGASTIGTGASAADRGDTTSAGSSPAATPSAAQGARVRAGSRTVVASGLVVPWDVAFLPDGDALVSEREGEILRLPAGGGKPSTLLTVPGVVAEGEGGLLGLAVSPTYATDHLVYAYFSAASDNRIASIDTQTKAVKPIFTGIRKGQIHNGGALAFGPDRMLYVGVGETGDTGLAQQKSALNGKILRITAAGKVPSGNPFKGSPVWTYGHRNVQGFAWDGAGRMWATEFGQETTDEVNLIRKGRNYGWPVVEGKGDTRGGRYTNPSVTWSPTSTSSPSGAAIVGRTLYVGALAGRKLWKIPIRGTSLGKPVGLLGGAYGRIRAVTAAPNGTVWFSTSNRDGRGSPATSDDRIVQLGL